MGLSALTASTAEIAGNANHSLRRWQVPYIWRRMAACYLEGVTINLTSHSTILDYSISDNLFPTVDEENFKTCRPVCEQITGEHMVLVS